MTLTAILLAGQRPGVDPLADAFGQHWKALVRVGGETMLSRVARMLVDDERIASVIVVAQDAEALCATPDTAWIGGHPKIEWSRSGSSISDGLIDVLSRHPDGYPFLVTTADNVLLDRAIIDEFVGRAPDSDVAFAMVERRTLLAAYPGNRRTWLRFRGGAYSGANLFLLRTPNALKALTLWRSIEQQRKKGRAVIGAFGPLILLGAGLRLLTLNGALARAGRRLGLTAAAVELSVAEACIDVDKVDDHVLVEEILARRA